MAELLTVLKRLLRDVIAFAEHASGLKLRRYQEDVARAVVSSILYHQGLTFVVIFPRQSGKNELQAQIETYVLLLLSQTTAEIVKVSPTWKPQSLNAMRRLERVLSRNLMTRDLWRKESGYIYRVGDARIFFLSGSPGANVVGATASALLECDEAQDVLIAKWDKDINPMAASTNATRVFWGTAWTSRTLLARERRAAEEAERGDGVRRVFVLDAEDVAAEVPAYGDFVAGEVRKHGRNHPFVKTQYFSEEIDAEGGMFPPGRLALMEGGHERQFGPSPGKLYAMLVDVAGEDEAATGILGEDGAGLLANAGRDATAQTIVEVDLSSLSDELIQAPTYRVVSRMQWVGVKHTALYAQLKARAEHWKVKYIVIDATGVGAGLASFLDKAFPGQVLSFIFSSASKSKLGWDFLTVIESGRYKEWGPAHDASFPKSAGNVDLQRLFFEQCEYCQMEIQPGPERRMKWGVPDGTRNDATHELVHDDLILSAALCTVLDEQEWGRAESRVVKAVDPLKDLGEVF